MYWNLLDPNVEVVGSFITCYTMCCLHVITYGEYVGSFFTSSPIPNQAVKQNVTNSVKMSELNWSLYVKQQ